MNPPSQAGVLTAVSATQPTVSADLDGPAKALRAILEEDRLKPHFQPILDLRTGKVHGFEGLIRGPSDSVLHSPMNLFRVAALSGQLLATEIACCRTLARAFVASSQPHLLFLNISPESLAHAAFSELMLVEMKAIGLAPDRVVIEVTENQPTHDYRRLVGTANRLREQGFTLAMDDLGAPPPNGSPSWGRSYHPQPMLPVAACRGLKAGSSRERLPRGPGIPTLSP